MRKTRATSAIALFLADDPELEDLALEDEDEDDGEELEDLAQDDDGEELEELEGGDRAPGPWDGYPAHYREIPPAMARTIATMEALLEGRPVPESKPEPSSSPSRPTSRDDERDQRGNTLRIRRYMARAFEAERARSGSDLADVLDAALEDEANTTDDLDRLASVARTVRRRLGARFSSGAGAALQRMERAIERRL